MKWVREGASLLTDAFCMRLGTQTLASALVTLPPSDFMRRRQSRARVSQSRARVEPERASVEPGSIEKNVI